MLHNIRHIDLWIVSYVWSFVTAQHEFQMDEYRLPQLSAAPPRSSQKVKRSKSAAVKKDWSGKLSRVLSSVFQKVCTKTPRRVVHIYLWYPFVIFSWLFSFLRANYNHQRIREVALWWPGHCQRTLRANDCPGLEHDRTPKQCPFVHTSTPFSFCDEKTWRVPIHCHQNQSRTPLMNTSFSYINGFSYPSYR